MSTNFSNHSPASVPRRPEEPGRAERVTGPQVARRAAGRRRQKTRREWDSNPRWLNTTPVFKTGAFVRSAIPPDDGASVEGNVG